MDFLKNQEENITIRQGENLSSSDTAPEGQEASPRKDRKIVRILEALLSVSIFALFFGIPLFFTGLTYQGLAFEKQIYFYFWLMLALVAWASRAVIVGELAIRRTPLDIPILVFWFVCLLSTIFSVDRWHSFWGFFGDPTRGLANLTAIVIAFYIINSNFTERRLRLAGAALILSSFLVALWTTLAVLGVQFLPTNLAQIAPFSVIGSVTGLATFLALMIPVLITGIFELARRQFLGTAKGKAAAAFIFATLALHIFLVLALNAYVPWPALLIGLGFFLIYILARVVRPAESWTWLPMAVFVVALVILWVGKDVRISRFNLPIEASPSYQFSWEIAKKSIVDRPVLGSGPATYGYDFSLHRPEQFNRNIFYNLRFYQGTGIIAEAIPTLGIAGSVAFLLLILTFVSVSVYLLSHDREKNKLLSLGFMSAALVALLTAVMARADGTIIILGSLLAVLALAVLMHEDETQKHSINLSLKASPKFALTLAFIFMVVSAGVAFIFVFIGKAFLADIRAGAAVRESEISEEGSIAKLSGAVRLNGREGRYFSRAAQEYLVLANREILKGEEGWDLDRIRNYFNGSIQAAVRGRDLMKNDVLIQEVLSLVYETVGIYESESLGLALEAYERAQNLEPTNPNFEVKIGLVKMYQAAGKEEEGEKNALLLEAKSHLQKAIELKENLAAAHYQLALASESLKEINEAVESMKKAVALENNNITFLFNLGRLYQQRGEGDDNKLAEELFKQVLGVNDKEINTHFSLAQLYEKTGRKSEAIDEYRKVLELLPAGSKDVRERIEELIKNVESGSSQVPAEFESGSENQVPVGPMEEIMEQPEDQPQLEE